MHKWKMGIHESADGPERRNHKQKISLQYVCTYWDVCVRAKFSSEGILVLRR